MTKANRSEQPEVQPEVQEVLQSTKLRLHVRNRLYSLKMNNVVSVEDVINHVILQLVTALQSSKVVTHPTAWAKVVSDRYIHSLYRKYKNLETLESDTIEYLANCRNEQKVNPDEMEEIHSKIQQMKPGSQQILLWRFFDGFSWDTIAKLLSVQEKKKIKPATARKRGERALEELRKQYE